MLPATNKGVGTNMGFPDVCNTPVGSATAPIPYPNIGLTALANPFALTVKICMIPALNMLAKITTTTGMEAGTAHPTIKGLGAYTMGNPIVHIEKSPAINLLCPTTGNNMNNALGAVLVPSVANVFFTRVAPLATSAQATDRSAVSDGAVSLSVELLESLCETTVERGPDLGLCLRQDTAGAAEVVHVRRGAVGHRIGLRAGDRIIIGPGAAGAVGDTRSGMALVVRRDEMVVPLVVGPDVAALPPAPRCALLDGTRGARIGYIEIGPLSLDSSTRLFNAIASLARDGFDALLLDLRGNPGGDLAAALRLADDFLPAGSVICRQRDRLGQTVHRTRNRRPYDHPLTLLVDGGTASAAEVFAGALQHHRRAVLVGEQTFGKGRAQTICPGNDGISGLYASVADIILPDGHLLDGVGLAPDIEAGSRREDAATFARLAPLRAADTLTCNPVDSGGDPQLAQGLAIASRRPGDGCSSEAAAAR